MKQITLCGKTWGIEYREWVTQMMEELQSQTRDNKATQTSTTAGS
jgi:hypothetical protein